MWKFAARLDLSPLSGYESTTPEWEVARWQNGDAADCKSAYGGSIPPRASKDFADFSGR
ncbi:hypothetical protein WCLP8_230009 [uncultured Gammaproteobacteria bacterium]